MRKQYKKHFYYDHYYIKCYSSALVKVLSSKTLDKSIQTETWKRKKQTLLIQRVHIFYLGAWSLKKKNGLTEGFIQYYSLSGSRERNYVSAQEWVMTGVRRGWVSGQRLSFNFVISFATWFHHFKHHTQQTCFTFSKSQKYSNSRHYDPHFLARSSEWRDILGPYGM